MPAVADTFTRSVTDNWGTSDSGHVWTNTGSIAAAIDVDGSKGTFNVTSASNTGGAQIDLGTLHFNAIFKFSHDTEAQGNLNRLRFTFRDSLYEIVIENNNGTPTYDQRVAIQYNVGPTSLANYEDTGATLGAQYYCRVVYNYGVCSVTIWKVGNSEPAPQMVAQLLDNGLANSSSPTNNTKVQFVAHRFSTNLMTATIDDFIVENLDLPSQNIAHSLFRTRGG